MDGVKIFAIVFITMNIIVGITMHGREKSQSAKRYDWYDGIFQTLLLLPLYGRIFDWW